MVSVFFSEAPEETAQIKNKIIEYAVNGQYEELKDLFVQHKIADDSEYKDTTTLALLNVLAYLIKLNKPTMFNQLASCINGGSFLIFEEVAEYLVSQPLNLEYEDSCGNKPLRVAVEYGNVKIVKALVESGADLKSKIDGKTIKALAHEWHNNNDLDDLLTSKEEKFLNAAKNNDLQQVVDYLAQGADVNYTLDEGKSSLHYAVTNKNEDIVSVLIENGINVGIKDDFRFTALQLAWFSIKDNTLELAWEGKKSAGEESLLFIAKKLIDASFNDSIKDEILCAALKDLKMYLRDSSECLLDDVCYMQNEIEKLLISYGANLDVKVYGYNKTARDLFYSMIDSKFFTPSFKYFFWKPEDMVYHMIETGNLEAAKKYYKNDLVLAPDKKFPALISIVDGEISVEKKEQRELFIASLTSNQDPKEKLNQLLQKANEHGFKALVEHLKKCGADLNCQTERLKNDSQNNLSSRLHDILNAGPKNLVIAAEKGDADTVKYLTANGVERNDKTKEGVAACVEAYYLGDYKKALACATADFKLSFGAGEGDLGLVKQAISEGADIHNTVLEFTPFFNAILSDNVKMVEELLKSGASFNACQYLLRDNTNVIKEVLRCAATPRPEVYLERASSSYKTFPLHFAIESNCIKVVNTLLGCHGIELNHQDSDGYTALMHAVSVENVSIMKQLIMQGANLQLRNADGKTARQIAAELDSDGILKVYDEAVKQMINIENIKLLTLSMRDCHLSTKAILHQRLHCKPLNNDLPAQTSFSLDSARFSLSRYS